MIGFIHNLELNNTLTYIIQHSMSDKIRINRIKVVLAEKELSQKKLAELVKRTPNTITRICNNESQPTLKFLREIALALNVDIRELLVPTKEIE
jgi:transcriptional regulator with XRE-family HTH domain